MPRYLMKIVPETKVYYVEASSSEEAQDAAWRFFKENIVGQLTDREIPGADTRTNRHKPLVRHIKLGKNLFDSASDAVTAMDDLQRKIALELTGA